MKQPVFFLFLCLFISVCRAQSPSTEQKAFLEALNRLVTHTTQYHWHYDEPMQVDSIFHLHGDTLSITWLCTTGHSQIRTRLAAPFSKIKSIDWDHYLVLNYQDEEVVRVYEQNSVNPEWRLIEQNHLLHIGVISGKEMKMKRRIEQSYANAKDWGAMKIWK